MVVYLVDQFVFVVVQDFQIVFGDMEGSLGFFVLLGVVEWFEVGYDVVVVEIVDYYQKMQWKIQLVIGQWLQ